LAVIGFVPWNLSTPCLFELSGHLLAATYSYRIDSTKQALLHGQAKFGHTPDDKSKMMKMPVEHSVTSRYHGQNA
jgi:hypothetical protein